MDMSRVSIWCPYKEVSGIPPIIIADKTLSSTCLQKIFGEAWCEGDYAYIPGETIRDAWNAWGRRALEGPNGHGDYERRWTKPCEELGLVPFISNDMDVEKEIDKITSKIPITWKKGKISFGAFHPTAFVNGAPVWK